MRAWHKDLIPKLCSKHLVACWRECLGMFKIITENKKGYRNHPAVKEYSDCPDKLWDYLKLIRNEGIKRGYNFKELPPKPELTNNHPSQWQTLECQIERLREKKLSIISCKCNV